ncbi:MAG TPA: sulfur carrier protein ThiS [Candidatus Baltobacteraceae bacterium]|nr:sulfur carrier protein ThiS [Candidatus Baltobacteraceae bacterium]
MKASINGEQRELPEDLTVAQLLAHLQAPERGIAVAKNDKVVRRSSFADEPVREGDRIEIIRAVAGG